MCRKHARSNAGVIHGALRWDGATACGMRTPQEVCGTRGRRLLDLDLQPVQEAI
jgi:hypothetical protein